MSKIGSMISAVAEKLPTVVKPDMKLNFNAKAKWTILILVAYFVLGSITIWGIKTECGRGDGMEASPQSKMRERATLRIWATSCL